jgi:DNA-binding NarL/FixJ family response regulator
MQHCSVVIASQEEVVRSVTRELLGRALPAVHLAEFSSAHSALDCVAAHGARLLIFDAELLNDPTLLRQIGQLGAELPILMLAADQTVQLGWEKAWRIQILEKRFLTHDLCPLVQRMLLAAAA